MFKQKDLKLDYFLNQTKSLEIEFACSRPILLGNPPNPKPLKPFINCTFTIMVDASFCHSSLVVGMGVVCRERSGTLREGLCGKLTCNDPMRLNY